MYNGRSLDFFLNLYLVLLDMLCQRVAFGSKFLTGVFCIVLFYSNSAARKGMESIVDVFVSSWFDAQQIAVMIVGVVDCTYKICWILLQMVSIDDRYCLPFLQVFLQKILWLPSWMKMFSDFTQEEITIFTKAVNFRIHIFISSFVGNCNNAFILPTSFSEFHFTFSSLLLIFSIIIFVCSIFL